MTSSSRRTGSLDSPRERDTWADQAQTEAVHALGRRRWLLSDAPLVCAICKLDIDPHDNDGWAWEVVDSTEYGLEPASSREGATPNLFPDLRVSRPRECLLDYEDSDVLARHVGREVGGDEPDDERGDADRLNAVDEPDAGAPRR